MAISGTKTGETVPYTSFYGKIAGKIYEDLYPKPDEIAGHQAPNFTRDPSYNMSSTQQTC